MLIIQMDGTGVDLAETVGLRSFGFTFFHKNFVTDRNSRWPQLLFSIRAASQSQMGKAYDTQRIYILGYFKNKDRELKWIKM